MQAFRPKCLMKVLNSQVPLSDLQSLQLILIYTSINLWCKEGSHSNTCFSECQMQKLHPNSTVHGSLHCFKTFYESYDLWKQLFFPATQVRFYNVFHLD
jgi:hypothetical protein